MKIKVIREQGTCLSGHICLYAWSESADDYFFYDNNRVYAIRYDFFNHNKKVLQPVDDPDSYDEDHNSVILDSDKKLGDFCEALKNSSYSNGDSFNFYNANCVHSVRYALEKANITISWNETRQCKHVFAFFCVSSTQVNPRELILTLKNYNNRFSMNSNPSETTPLKQADHHGL